MVVGLSVMVVLLAVSVYYNTKLHRRLLAYEQVWKQIEQVADRNEDGTFTINIQHLEHVHDTEAHLNTDESGIHLLDLDSELQRIGLSANNNRTDDGPPRAA